MELRAWRHERETANSVANKAITGPKKCPQVGKGCVGSASENLRKNNIRNIAMRLKAGKVTTAEKKVATQSKNTKQVKVFRKKRGRWSDGGGAGCMLKNVKMWPAFQGADWDIEGY